MIHVRSVKVSIWGKTVGHVYPDPTAPWRYLFQYDKGFVESGIQLSPLMMPLDAAPCAFDKLPKAQFHGLPPMIADAFPDSFGNAIIDEWMRVNGVNKQDISPLDRLAYMGKRAMGALEFAPDIGPQDEHPSALEMSDLVEAASLAVSGKIGDARALLLFAQLVQVGTSAGGTRPKAVIAWNRKTGGIRAGQTGAPRGFEHWLIKFDGLTKDGPGREGKTGRIEYAYSLMARQAGIPMSECAILEDGGRSHFATKRFDRDGNRKHHVQTLCALTGKEMDSRWECGEAFALADALGLPIEDKPLLFRQMVFNVLAGNCDDHIKNISFILHQGGSWRLAPAYDLMHEFIPADSRFRHCMSVNGKFAGIGREDFLAEAGRHSIPDADRMYDEVSEAVRGWPEFAKAAGVKASDAEAVRRDLESLAAASVP